MIYLDSSALVKLTLLEAESADLEKFLSAHPQRICSALAIAEVRRAVRRSRPDKLGDAEKVLSGLLTVPLSREILRAAGTAEPPSLRTLDAIHLASALLVQDDLAAFVAYDTRLLEAARTLGMTTASPGL